MLRLLSLVSIEIHEYKTKYLIIEFLYREENEKQERKIFKTFFTPCLLNKEQETKVSTLRIARVNFSDNTF